MDFESKPAKPLRILLLEDVPTDAELEEAELRDAGLAFHALRVDTRAAFEQALDEFGPDIILADYRLPQYSGREALEYVRRTHPDIPCIMVTGALGDEAAVDLLKLGARDYVLKDTLARLSPAIRRAISEETGIRQRKLAEGKYKALFAEAMDGIVLIDCTTWQITDCNSEVEKLTGRSLEQLKQLKAWEVMASAQHDRARQCLLEVYNTGSGRGSEFKVQKPGGETTPIEFSAKYLNLRQQSFIQCIIRDISARLQAEQALRESEARYRRITQGITDYQYTVRVEGGRAVETIQSPACVKVTGYTAAEYAANPDLWLQMIVPEDRERVQKCIRQVFEGENIPPVEHRIVRKDGEIRWVIDTIIAFRDSAGTLLSYDGVVSDITERKRAEQVIRDEKALADSLIESMPGMLLLIDRNFNLLRWNNTVPELVGLAPSDLPAADVLSYVHEQDRQLIIEDLQEALATGSSRREVRLLLQQGLRHYVITGTRVETQLGTNVIAIGIDITERKVAEEALQHANRALQTLSAGNLALVQAQTEADLLVQAANVIVDKGGYQLAVVDFAGDDPEKSLIPMAWSGLNESRYWADGLTWADTERGQLPASKAVRTGKMQICQDIAGDPGFEPWRGAIKALGYGSNIALPLAGGGRTFGCLSIYSSEKAALDPQEIGLLEEFANDLAYGIMSLRARVEREQHARLLRQSLEQSIQTIAGTVEARDPYTAGHQRRVAELATAIATEMALPENQVNGIHLAAIIHDLGKIQIPAEILSKPGKLTELEFMLIKTHPQAGYDVIKGVNFPWPIADIILQHHERLDGSGYPRGLKGEQILQDSRIITVADVVEAMSSHRPYRAALGVDAALDEIRRGRGGAYDSAVVDACLKVFAEKGFKFSA